MMISKVLQKCIQKLLVCMFCMFVNNFCFAQTNDANIKRVESLIFASQIAIGSNDKDGAIDNAQQAERIAQSLNNPSLIARTKGNLGFVYYKFNDSPIRAKELLNDAVASYYRNNLKNPEFLAYQQALVDLQAKNEGATSTRLRNVGNQEHILTNTAMLFTGIDRHVTADEVLDSLIRTTGKTCDNLKVRTVKAFSYLKQNKKKEALFLLQCCVKCYSDNKIIDSPEYPFIAREYVKLHKEIHNDYPSEFVYAGIEVTAKGLESIILELAITPKGENIWKISDQKIEPRKINSITNLAPTINKLRGDLVSIGVSNDNIYVGFSDTIDSLYKHENWGKISYENYLKCNSNNPVQIDLVLKKHFETLFEGIERPNRQEIVITELNKNGIQTGHYLGIGQKQVFRIYELLNTKILVSNKSQIGRLENDSTDIKINQIKQGYIQSLRNDGLINRSNFIITGSISNALITLLETSIDQQKINDNKFYPINEDELTQLEALLVKDDARLKNPDLLSLSLDKVEIAKKIAKIYANHTNTDLLAGLKFIKLVMKSLNTQEPKKRFQLSKDEYFGWVIGAINNH